MLAPALRRSLQELFFVNGTQPWRESRKKRPPEARLSEKERKQLEGKNGGL